MPAVAGVVAVIAGVVSAIATIVGATVIATIAGIVGQIASAVYTIGTLIRHGLRGNIFQIASVLIGIGNILGKAWKSIENKLIDLYIQYGISEQYEKAELIEKILWDMDRIEAVVNNSIQTIYAPVESVIINLRTAIEEAFGWLDINWQDVVRNIQKYHTNLIGGILACISEPYREYLKTLDILYYTAKAWDAFQNQKWGAGIYYILKQTNLRINNEINNLIQLIEQKQSSLKLLINKLFEWVKTDVGTLNDWLMVHTKILSDIGKVFGAEEFTDLADAFDRFRKYTLEKVENIIKNVEKRFNKFWSEITEPITLFISQWHMARSENRRIRDMFRILSLEHLRESFSYVFSVKAVPVLTIKTKTWGIS
jgi:hypothetical protein